MGTADPRISVVVPFYNNVDLLADCLASIADQTLTDLEVIMVDDGSTDGSAEIAAARVAADPRFTLVQVPNGGPGSARNCGVAAASGEFLAFVDADDLLPSLAYATLLAVLEQTGSDFVSGGVLRLTAEGLGGSGLHDQAIKTRSLRTHISRTPALCYDISVWNKLFRRSFWTRAGLSFPQDMLWEDLVAMTKAHVLATAVDVITDPIYHWRDRDKGAPSITQSRTSISNFRDRITALLMIDDFLRARGTLALLRHHQHKALVNDLWLYVRDLAATTPEYQREFTDLAGKYLRQVDKRLIRGLPATRKLAYHLIGSGREADLVEFASWLAENPGRTPPVVRSFGRLRADLPFRRSASGGKARPWRAIPAWVFTPQWRELVPQVRVDAITWQRRSLIIEGSAYVPSMDIGRRRNTTKLVVLVPRGRRGLPVVVPAQSLRRPEATASSGQSRYRYDWSGFRCRISPRWFGAGRHWLTGEWDSFILVRGRAAWRPARLHSPAPQALVPKPMAVAPHVTFGARWAGNRLRIAIRSEPASRPAAAGRAAADTASEVAISQTWAGGAKLALRASLPEPGAYQVVFSQSGGWARHVIDVSCADGELSAVIDVGAIDYFGDRVPLRDGRWEVSLRRVDGDVPVTVRAEVDSRLISAGRKTFQCASGERHSGEGHSGEGHSGHGHSGHGHSGHGGRDLVLSVAPRYGPLDGGRIRRRLLREVYYPVQRLLPVRDAVLFISFDGRTATDNPLGIAKELRRRGDQRDQIWAVNDWSVAVPPDSRAVLIGTAAYLAALGRSAYVVANDHVALPYRRRRGQRYVQTWHGTPLKRLGWDIVKPSFASGDWYFDFLARDVAQWDLLLSPNPFTTPIMRQAFRYTGEIAETGYPRDDALVAGRPAGSMASLRERLGLPPGKRVAMYVPTWRENQRDDASGYRFEVRLDLAAARQRLADDYVLLIRGHHRMAGWALADAEPGFVVDVTGYPDINDLLALTDVLVTDYSSVMFDFAPSGRPMVFFTYDLESYRDQLRGFYFDFEAAAPGPLVSTSGELIETLADIDAVAVRYRAASETFTARFCPLDDGKASARACDRIFKD
ncbi:MAG TPA: CDP-glycerol glycerophosphotransferase family protein [Streptosporangiaceae bacterium]|nr:CDP-glycerol glycerophosphotransferase family protein [Streptosporangiaceae bacterium]